MTNTWIDSSAITTTPIPFPSLIALRAKHDKLQRELKTDSAVREASQSIIDFVCRAIQTGACLDAKEARESAQAVINYWVSRSVAAGTATGGSHPFADPVFDTLLEEFHLSTLDEAMTAANRWIDQDLNAEEQTLIRRILVRLLRLRDDGSVVSLPFSRFSFDDLEPRERVAELLDRLNELGITQVTNRPNGIELVSLRSDLFIEQWPFLKLLVEQRTKLRKIAGSWIGSRSQPGNHRGGIGRFIRRYLMSLGKRIDQGWEKVIRLFGGQVIVVQDPSEEFPEVDYYRDRNQTEIDYLFQRRTLSKESKEWMRVVKGLAAVSLFLLATIVSIILVKRHLEIKDLDMKKTREVAQAKDNEIKVRRARQRLKEQINLVHLLAQHQQYDNPRNFPRAQIAKWRIQAPIQGMDSVDLQDLQNELQLIGVAFNIRENGVCAECSDSPLEVAKKLKDLIHSRISDPESKDFDRDTLTYRNNLIRTWYTAAEKLVIEICRFLEEKGTFEKPHNYDALAGYLDEFWVLYYGEMAIVESERVERRMKAFGDALKDVDRHFHNKLSNKLAAIPGVTKRDIKTNQNSNAAVKATLWKSTNNDGKVDDSLAEFLQKPILELQRAWAESERRGLSSAIKVLTDQRDLLTAQLREELDSLPKSSEESKKQ